MNDFEERFPDRLFNVGIAEQNMIGVAAGLANAGLIPIFCSASAFLCARAFEQIKVDIGYSNANVKLFGVSPGFAYGALGATHHSPEDVTLIQSIPNINIAVPADPEETRSATESAIYHDGPSFVRVLRTPVPKLKQSNARFTFGKSVELSSGSDVLFIANGLMVHETLKAIDVLEQHSLSCGLINASSVRPIDNAFISSQIRNYKYVITVEEGCVLGGMGSTINQLNDKRFPKPVLNLGVSEFAPTGSTKQILSYFKLDSEGIIKKAFEFFRKDEFEISMAP